MNNLLSIIALGALAGLLATGCSKGSSSSTTTSTTVQASPAPGAVAAGGGSAAAPPTGDAKHGQQIFAQNCASCHGAKGIEGGVGPSLKNEKSKKNLAAAIAWIKNPQPPMPKLFPAPLGEKDVADVAAYVETL